MTIYPVVIHDWRIFALVIAFCFIGYLGSKAKARHEAHKRCEAFRIAFNNDCYD